MLMGALWLLQGGQTGKGSSWESGRRGLDFRTPGKMALPELGWLDGGWGEISSSDMNTIPPSEDTQVWAPGKGLEMSSPR